MLMYLEAVDFDYPDIINDGPPVSTKLVVITATLPEYYIIKEMKEQSLEEKVAMLKDVKVRNIFHNSLDSLMSNRVITCKPVKEIWYVLKTQCQEIMTINKNMRTVLIQEYKHFEVKTNESFTYTYDKFVTLLNNPSLVEKVYEIVDGNHFHPFMYK